MLSYYILVIYNVNIKSANLSTRGEIMMNNCDYMLYENKLMAKDFIRLKVATGFRDRPIEQVEKALSNDLLDVVAMVNNEVVGMGRLVGDGVMYWYLQEIIVLPEFQGKGIGTSIGLTAAEGKETFYERFGFTNSNGMNKYIER